MLHIYVKRAWRNDYGGSDSSSNLDEDIYVLLRANALGKAINKSLLTQAKGK